MPVDWSKQVLGPCINVFGQAVAYASVDGVSFQISGIYDEAYHEIEVVDGGIPVTTSTPVLGVRLSDFPTPPAQDDTLTIVDSGEVFVVREVRPDGHGGAKLMLNYGQADV